jgi:hypothetical protein
MKMVLQLAVQDIGQLTYLVAPSGFPLDRGHSYKKYGRIVSLG